MCKRMFNLWILTWLWYKSAADTAQRVRVGCANCRVGPVWRNKLVTYRITVPTSKSPQNSACRCLYLSVSHFMNFNPLWNSHFFVLHEKITNAKVNSDDERYLSIFLLMQKTEARLWNHTINLLFFIYEKLRDFFLLFLSHRYKYWHCILPFLHDMQSMWYAFFTSCFIGLI